MNKLYWRLYFFCFIFLFTYNASAQEADILDFGGRIPSKDEFIRAFEPSVVTRSISQSPAKPRGISLNIHFDFDSYILTDRSQEVLNNLGAAMVSDQLMTFRFRVEGHTDAKGARDYNMVLSEKRAEAVSNYLTNIFGIPDSRLDVLGMGEYRLWDQGDPNSAKNRRVQIVNLLE